MQLLHIGTVSGVGFERMMKRTVKIRILSKRLRRSLCDAVKILACRFRMQTTGNYQGLFAGVVIVFIPTVIIYILLAKQIMSGSTAGSVKG